MRNQENQPNQTKTARVRVLELRAILSAIAPDEDERVRTLDALIAIEGAARRAIDAPAWLGELQAAIRALDSPQS